MLKNIVWLGHDTFRISGSRTIYTDPFQINRKDHADIILITHEHYDHCSPEDVGKLKGSETVVVAPPDCAEKLGGSVKTVRPGDRLAINGSKFRQSPRTIRTSSFTQKTGHGSGT